MPSPGLRSRPGRGGRYQGSLLARKGHHDQLPRPGVEAEQGWPRPRLDSWRLPANVLEALRQQAGATAPRRTSPVGLLHLSGSSWLYPLFGTRIDPLRAKNPDFEIVGPPWLAVVAFVALVLAHGMLVAALAGRYSKSLPLLSRRRRAIAGHVPLLLVAPAAFGVVILAVVGLVAVALSQQRPVVEVIRSRRLILVGRIALGVIVLVALASFIASISVVLGSPA